MSKLLNLTINNCRECPFYHCDAGECEQSEEYLYIDYEQARNGTDKDCPLPDEVEDV